MRQALLIFALLAGFSAASAGTLRTLIQEQTSIMGDVDKAGVIRTINGNLQDLIPVYEEALNHTPHCNGKIQISAVISGDGIIKNAKVKSTTVHAYSDERFEAAVLARVNSWKFQASPTGQIALVSMTLTFRELPRR